MRTSGTGGHRRPRQAPRFVVTVGATGAGIALPLIASAGTAHAATASVWDRVAACETGGDWTAVADGFAGGLGLTQGAWLANGGTDYTDTPERATPEQQITVARRILADDGPQYWGACANTAGLTAADATASPSPATTATPAPGTGLLGGILGGLLGGPDGGTATSAPAPGAPTAPASATPPPAGATGAPTGSPAPSASAPSGDPSASAPPASGGTSAGAGRHARPGPSGGDATTPPARPGPGAHARPEVGAPSEGGEPVHIVRPGEDLYRIAAEHHVPGGWQALYHANASVLGGDPGVIHPGQSLLLD